MNDTLTRHSHSRGWAAVLVLISAIQLVLYVPSAIARPSKATQAVNVHWVPITSENDPRLKVSMVAIPGPTAHLSGYLVMPKTCAASGTHCGAIVLLVENRGLTRYAKDLARRYALERFIVLAPDYLGPQGGQPADENAAHEMVEKLTDGEIVDSTRQAMAFLRTIPGVHNVGAVGYGKGGSQVDELASTDYSFQAAVTYYSSNLIDLSKVPLMSAVLLKHYDTPDPRRNAKIPPLKSALQHARKRYRFYSYQNVKWGFANAYGMTYDKAADALAWKRTIAFLHKYLG